MVSDLNVIILESETPELAGNIAEKLNNVLARPCISVSCRETIDGLNNLKPDLVILDPALDYDTAIRSIQKAKVLDLAMPVFTSVKECLPVEPYYAPFEGVYCLNPKADVNTIVNSIEKAFEEKKEFEKLPNHPLIIGKSPNVTSVRAKIRKIADKDVTVLVTGETGTGKELVARSIHQYSQRNKEPLIKVDCTSLPDELLESEVFGFQKGAFTDAYRDKPGRLELANGGTLFIDEIGDISFPLQVKFLQIFEDREFSRLGGTTDKSVDVRVILATNADLWGKVKNGSFREDLYYRINVMQIEIPPLRERKEDVPLLIDYFHNKYSYEFKRKIIEIPEKVQEFFIAYPWPGNIRELENIIRRAIAISDWNLIYEEMNQAMKDRDNFSDQANDIDDYSASENRETLMRLFKDNDYSLKKISKSYVADAESEAILETLNSTQWNRTKAAKLLGVSYKTLTNRIDSLRLKP